MGNGRLRKLLSGLSIAALIAGSSSAGMACEMCVRHANAEEHPESQLQEIVKEGESQAQKHKKDETKEQSVEVKEKVKHKMSGCSGMSGCGGSGCGGMMKEKEK